MNTAEYLDRLLLQYAGTFDIYQSYQIGGREYPAYGYFFSHTEKYVLVREANMWSADSYEHIIFMEAKQIEPAHIKEAGELIRTDMEAELVRKGAKYPEKNHMYSYLTVVLLSQKPLTPETKKAIKKYHYDKSYLFNMRGFSQGRLIAAVMENETVYTSRAAVQSKKAYTSVFAEVKQGKQGFKAHCEENEITLKKQLI